jgi:hypothetical protein
MEQQTLDILVVGSVYLFMLLVLAGWHWYVNRGVKSTERKCGCPNDNEDCTDKL